MTLVLREVAEVVDAASLLALLRSALFFRARLAFLGRTLRVFTTLGQPITGCRRLSRREQSVRKAKAEHRQCCKGSKRRDPPLASTTNFGVVGRRFPAVDASVHAKSERKGEGSLERKCSAVPLWRSAKKLTHLFCFAHPGCPTVSMMWFSLPRSSSRWRNLLLVVAGATGCATPWPAAEAPEVGAQRSADANSSTTASQTSGVSRPGAQSLRIPGGETCLSWLPKLSIDYRVLPPKPGMETPVEVRGPIAGIRYTTLGNTSVVADCRLILALDWIGPSLRQLGVTEVRHSGAYVYRAQKGGRPSLHALGLAIDVHELRYSGGEAVVERDFARGLHDACDPKAPELNQMVCRLNRLGLFQELITPDNNADHSDHIHLAISARSEQG